MLKILVAALMAIGLLAPGAAPRAQEAAKGLTVFAAASLTNALPEVGQRWQNQNQGAGREQARFSFAASSTLARQIEQGADADIFIAAEEEWMDYLVKRGRIIAQTRQTPIGNRLVLIAPAERPVSAELKPGFDLVGLLGGGRLATGDPAHVPVGRYAEEALRHLGVWSDALPRLARTDTVRAALVLVERGEASLGIVFATDAKITPRVRVAGVFPENSHPPIVYPMAIVAGRDSPAARSFLAFLAGPEAKTIFQSHGFTVAGR